MVPDDFRTEALHILTVILFFVVIIIKCYRVNWSFQNSMIFNLKPYTLCDRVVTVSGKRDGSLPGVVAQQMHGGTVLNICPLVQLCQDQVRILNSLSVEHNLNLRCKIFQGEMSPADQVTLEQGGFDFGI